MQKRIGTIGNYYGGLHIKDIDEEYYWSIENWNGHDWQKIPESLYKELLKFQEEKDKQFEAVRESLEK